MDFDKIKKAAKNTIKIVSDKVEETFTRPDEDETIEIKTNPVAYDDVVDDFSDNDDLMGNTQRFDMKDALNRFRKHKDEIEDKLSDIIKNDEADTSSTGVNEFIEDSFTNLEKGINESISDIDTDISNLSAQYKNEFVRISDDVSNLSRSVDKASTETVKINASIAELSNNLESAIMDINKKLNDISSSISGVNKINDSIFDLKNSQVNTKNVLGDLDASFANLKKKMTAGVTILSVISAIIVILEVINLLS